MKRVILGVALPIAVFTFVAVFGASYPDPVTAASLIYSLATSLFCAFGLFLLVIACFDRLIPALSTSDDLSDRVVRSVVSLWTPSGLVGTGVIVAETHDGFLILTAAHLRLRTDHTSVSVYPFKEPNRYRRICSRLLDGRSG